jgi:hypothetical protein
MNANPYFVHLRVMEPDGNGGKKQCSDWAATVAINLCHEDVVAGVALCSPKDQFSRKRGREIAQGRLASGDGIVLEKLAPAMQKHEDFMKAARLAVSVFASNKIKDINDFEHIVRDLVLNQ